MQQSIIIFVQLIKEMIRHTDPSPWILLYLQSIKQVLVIH